MGAHSSRVAPQQTTEAARLDKMLGERFGRMASSYFR